MRAWFERMGARLSRAMYGRYGNDRLNRVLIVTSLVLLLLSYIRVLRFCWFLSLALLIWVNVRCFSRKIDKRRRELARFDRMHSATVGFFRLRKKMIKERKTHLYFHCKGCRAMLRVPRGKGEIDVTCPKCGRITVKKS